MAKSPEQMLAMIVAGAQPHCDEPLETAIICGHAGSMAQGLVNILTTGGGVTTRTSDLPNPLIIAVGPTTIYAFEYKPKGFKIKVKKGAEAARWARDRVSVEEGQTGAMSQFALVTDTGEMYAFEVTTMMGGHEGYDLFLSHLRPRTA